MRFVIATNNPHKLAEIRRILHRLGHSAQSLAQAGVAIQPEETGASFEENALIKARAVCAVAAQPAIADDSGLCVDALDGAPGVHSARFAGSHNDAANNQKLLQLLADVPPAGRTARFVSVVALALPGGASLTAQGSCEGSIGFALRGQNGFGYDPLFMLGARSFAEMCEEEKDAVSHRAAALKQFAQQLPGFLQQQGFG